MGNCQTIPNNSNAKIPSTLKKKSQVIIKTYTWPRDSHGLFDYECNNLNKNQFKTSTTGRLVRSANDVILMKDSDNLIYSNDRDKDILRIYCENGNYWVKSCEIPKTEKPEKTEKPDSQNATQANNIDDDLWVVVKSLRNPTNIRGAQLTGGDIIKLGRVKFKIKEVKSMANSIVNENKIEKSVEKKTLLDGTVLSHNENLKKNESLKDLESSISNQKMCRICLFENCEIGDPFISPCNCSGSMKYIHFKCLQKWLKSRVHSKVSGPCTTIYWKTFSCELCKKGYPEIFDVEGKQLELIDIDKPDCPFVILEIVGREKNSSRGMYLIKMDNKNTIRMGRGHDSDIRITDISVSRCHAVIKLEKGNFYIEDNNSKFGTLISSKKSLLLAGAHANCQLQFGRTVVEFSISKNWKILPGCFSSPKNASDVIRDEDESPNIINNNNNNNGNNESSDELEINQGPNINNHPANIHHHQHDGISHIDQESENRNQRD